MKKGDWILKVLKSSNDRDWEMLEWYLRFLNTPVSDLRTRGERLDFFDYFSEFAFGKLIHVASEQDERPHSPRLEQYRKCCRIIFTAIWNKRKYSPSVIDVSKIYRYLALAQILKTKETIRPISVSFSVLVDSDGECATVKKIPSVNWNAEFDIHFVNALISATIDFLKPFDLLRFRKCAKKECRKFFYQRTKREKNYCSNRCAGTVRQRKFQKDKREQNNPSRITPPTTIS